MQGIEKTLETKKKSGDPEFKIPTEYGVERIELVWC